MSQIFKTTNQKQFSILLLVEEMWIHWHHGQRNLGLPSDLPFFLFGALPGDGFFIQHLMKQPELKASGHLPMGILWLLFPGIQLHVFTKLTLIIIYIVIVLFLRIRKSINEVASKNIKKSMFHHFSPDVVW